MTLKNTIIGLLISLAISLPIYGLAADAASPDELLFWDSIKDSSNRADFVAYLTQYPNGRFVPLAKNRLAPSSAESESTIAAQSATTEDLPSILIDSNLGNNEKIELTILNEKYAQTAIDIALRKFDPAFKNFFPKAQYLNYLLNKNGKKSGKFFIQGKIAIENANGKFSLKYFNLPLVAINKNGKPIPYVIDFYHSPSKQLYTIEEWKNEVLIHDESVIDSEYFTNQFHFSTDTKGKVLTQMESEDRDYFVQIARDSDIFIKNY